MTPTTANIVSEYALRMRAAAPKEFEAFVQAFDAYATEVTVAVTVVGQHEILNQQGRAQFALHFLKLLRECHIPPKPKTPPPNQPPPQPTL